MIEVTTAATNAIIDYFKGKKKRPIRISVITGGCGIRFLGVAEEERRTGDECFDVGGFRYLIAQSILKEYSPITIDSDGFSFRLSGSGIYPPNGCGTCAFGCGSRGKIRCNGNCRTCATPCPTGRRQKAKRSRLADFIK
jgi:iron-sulfur cluster assembly protein